MFSFADVFELCVFPGVCSAFAVAFPVLSLVCVSFTDGCVLFPLAGCIPVVFAVVFPVIAKEENPGVCAAKYR